MALGSALIHRARIIRRGRSGARVEGGKLKNPVEGPWFRCRYEPGSEAESRDPGTVRKQRSATLLIGRRDSLGDPLDVQGGDEVEIQWTPKPDELIRMSIQGTPEPIQRRRTILGYRATLGKVQRA